MLERIERANDIKMIPEESLPELAKEIRKFLIANVSQTGGHLASNLGVVELTIALHKVFSLPEDKLIWDVGHQSYTHKILTGRKDAFDRLRMVGGISGFPRRSESVCDSFDTGHSSTSIAAGLGYVTARDLKHQEHSVVSIIGDGSVTGGLAYEALNNAAHLKTNYIIVLNDNEMSISKNVGGMSEYLSKIRTSAAYTDMKMNITDRLSKIPHIGEGVVDALRNTKNGIKQLVIPGMLFENMGMTYLGPVDGHNIRQLIRVLNEAKKVKGPVVVHTVTKKGKGYTPAMRHPSRFHGTGPFEVQTGVPSGNGTPTYTDIFSTVMCKMGEKRKDLVAITAAMADGTGLQRFANRFPKRFMDVGIAEGFAVTYAAGLSLGGMTPVVAVYSTFLQRAFDQLIEDVCMQKLHVVFAIDRAGFVGADGRTHNGCFDLSYLTQMPNMTVMAPKNYHELSDMLKFAMDFDGPIAIRYPKGEAYGGLLEYREPIVKGKGEILKRGKNIALLCIGSMVKTGNEISERLEKEGISNTLVNLRFAKPLDEDLLKELAAEHSLFVTMEENQRIGGVGMQILDFVNREQLPVEVEIAAIPDEYIGHGGVDWQKEQSGIDAEHIYEKILAAIAHEKSVEPGRQEHDMTDRAEDDKKEHDMQDRAEDTIKG